MDYIDRIILEEINRVVLSEKSHKAAKSKSHSPISDEAYRAIMKYYTHYKNKGLSEKQAHDKAIKKYKEKLKKKKKEELRLRKKKGGGHDTYNYTRYQEKNGKVSSGDYRQLADRIDQDKSDIAAIAREVFPGHTDEGAQSQLRKILNGERPMTRKVAQKLEDMISSGQIAVKA